MNGHGIEAGGELARLAERASCFALGRAEPSILCAGLEFSAHKLTEGSLAGRPALASGPLGAAGRA